jgi:hypothetical protein
MKNLRVNIPKPPRRITPGEPIFAMGSCFAEAISLRMNRLGCEAYVNPFGTVYNAVSITRLLERIIENRPYVAADFTEHQGRFFSLEHATGLAGSSAQEAMTTANERLAEAHAFARQASVFLLTFGTSVVYGCETTAVVANCHKLPHSRFSKRILSVEENRAAIEQTIKQLHAARPDALIVITLSPVRHTPHDLCENGLSKANLRAALGLVAATGAATYFPAYEMALDELRDRVHYAHDAVHLRPHAVAAIARRFMRHYFSSELLALRKEASALRKQSRHRHIHPDSPAARAFDARLRERIAAFCARCPKEHR